MPYDLPKVSCCLCTYDRLELTKKSIICYTKQTYPNKELLIVTEGPIEFKNNIKSFISTLNREDIRLLFLTGERTLGEVRNISIKESSGDLYCQWDDDDFNHPKRLSTQIGYLLRQNLNACFLKDQLHLYWQDKELFWEKWDYKSCPDRCCWIPGTIIMKIDKRFSYPEKGDKSKAGEDVVLVDQLWDAYIYDGFPIGCLEDMGYMHVYSFHGNLCEHKNTFNSEHHRYLSKNNSLNITSLLNKQKLICASLDDFDLGLDEIKIMGKDGLAFTYERNR